VSWSFYDVSHNRPFICYMYFDYDGKDPQKERDEIYTALKSIADREMALDTMAYGIDKRLKNVLPKLIKRVDLGPIHNVFAKDENKVTHAILQGIESSSEFKEGSFFSKQTFQKWNDPYRQRYVFAPHRIIQLLHNKTPEIMNKLAMPPVQISEFET